MTNRFLCRNGRPCDACGGTGDGPDILMHAGEFVGETGRSWPQREMRGLCSNCRGLGRVAIPDEEIVAGHVAEAREHYWPERVRRWAAGWTSLLPHTGMPPHDRKAPAQSPLGWGMDLRPALGRGPKSMRRRYALLKRRARRDRRWVRLADGQWNRCLRRAIEEHFTGVPL